jgi:hypothetical protein
MRIAALLYDPPDEEITMNMKYALCGIALAALVTPALAAGPFYVVQNIATKARRSNAPSWRTSRGFPL